MLTLFIIWSLPIALGFILLGFLVARAAKKRGKNPWLWGSLTVVLITVVSWQQIPTWAAHIFLRGMAMKQLITPQGKITTLAEAKKITIRVSVDGVNFDVPLVYDFRGYNQQLHGWVGVPQGQIEGKESLSVDYVEVDALLPDIKNTFGRLQRQPDSPEVPGLLHYYDSLGKADMYFSHDYPTDELISIHCSDEKIFHYKSPSCKAETSYRPAPDLVAAKHIEGAIFHLEYSLPSQYISQWREIDRKLRSLFDQFIKNAT